MCVRSAEARSEDVRSADARCKYVRCEDVRYADVRCEDVLSQLLFLEEPCAQALSGKGISQNERRQSYREKK